jgi:hypothetical protein
MPIEFAVFRDDAANQESQGPAMSSDATHEMLADLEYTSVVWDPAVSKNKDSCRARFYDVDDCQVAATPRITIGQFLRVFTS